MSKNWCFWTVVLEKTLESPLDCKEIQPANPKGNQFWIFIGQTNAEAETPVLGYLMWRTESFAKTLTLGKTEGGRRKGQQRKRWLDGITNTMEMGLVGLQDFLSITNSWSLLKLTSIKSVMPPNYLILCCPLLLLSSAFPSIRVFSNESVLCITWPKDWTFSFSISPSKEYSWLISFRIGWLDLLAVQGTLKSLLQHHRSKASILWHSAFFIVQLLHPYITTGKPIALTRQAFVDKVMSLLFKDIFHHLSFEHVIRDWMEFLENCINVFQRPESWGKD